MEEKSRRSIIELVVGAYNAAPGHSHLADLMVASEESVLLGDSDLEPSGLFVTERKPEVATSSAEIAGTNRHRKKSRTNRRMRRSGLY